MPRIHPLTPEDAPPESRPLLEDTYRQRGSVSNLLRTLAHRPQVMDAAWGLMRAVLGSGTVELRLKELVAVRTSQINRCKY